MRTPLKVFEFEMFGLLLNEQLQTNAFQKRHSLVEGGGREGNTGTFFSP